MASPWDRIADEDYRVWLEERQITAAEYNDLKTLSLLDRSALRGQYEQQQQQQLVAPAPVSVSFVLNIQNSSVGILFESLTIDGWLHIP